MATFDNQDTAPNPFDYIVFSLLLIFHIVLIGMYIWVYFSLKSILD